MLLLLQVDDILEVFSKTTAPGDYYAARILRLCWRTTLNINNTTVTNPDEK